GDDVGVLRHRVVDQRTLPGPGHTGDHAQHAERDVDVHVLQVVRVRPADLQLPGRLPHRLLQRDPVVQVAAGDGAAGAQSRDVTLVAHLAAVVARARPQVDHVV